MTGSDRAAPPDSTAGRGRRADVAGLAQSAALGWLLVVVLTIYVLYATYDWRLPTKDGDSFGPIWAILSAAGVVAARVVRGRWEAVAALAIGVGVAMLLTDLVQFSGQLLRDLGIYLRAGEHFLAGEPVYLTTVLTESPTDKTLYPYLYPPPTLPILAVLAVLPRLLVDLGWVAGSAAAALGGLRLLGLSWRWAVAALFWPPFFQGLYVGNVSVLLFALFVVAPWFGAGLLVTAIFKPYSVVAALWLVRERHLRAIGLGIAILAGATVVTLPLVGFDQWRAWVDGLRLYTESQEFVPASLVAMALPGYVPWLVYVGLAIAAVGWAWLGRGSDGLARFGVATVVGSPSLFAHGFLVALPAFLGLGAPWLWIALGITSVAPGLGWWLSIGLVVAASFVPAPQRDRLRDVRWGTGDRDT